MASFRKRNNRWHVPVRKSGHIKTRSFSYKSDAETWARLIEREIDTAQFTNDSHADLKLTVEELLDRYHREVSAKKKGAKVEADIISRFKRHRLASLEARSISSSDISQYRVVQRVVGRDSGRKSLTRVLIANAVKNQDTLLSKLRTHVPTPFQPAIVGDNC